MMDTVRETRIGKATLTLVAYDQMNDYSVKYDYVLRMSVDGANFDRSWPCGSHRGDALELFERAIPIVRKLQD